jgi:integrase/recombinase XerD
VRDPSRVRVAGPLAGYADGFHGALAERGYSRGAAAVQLQVMGHLSGVACPPGPGRFGADGGGGGRLPAERRSLGCASHWSRRALAPLLGFLRRREVTPAPMLPGPTSPPVEALLARYARYLAGERGLAEATIRRNVELVRPFVAGLEKSGRSYSGG